MDASVAAWRESLRYLPKFLRDFHDQKDVFKTLHDEVGVHKHEYAKEVGWIMGQCYVIDIFLWHMARHGWVLRRSPLKLKFDDIETTNAESKERRMIETGRVIAKMFDKKSANA